MTSPVDLVARVAQMQLRVPVAPPPASHRPSWRHDWRALWDARAGTYVLQRRHRCRGVGGRWRPCTPLCGTWDDVAHPTTTTDLIEQATTAGALT